MRPNSSVNLYLTAENKMDVLKFALHLVSYLRHKNCNEFFSTHDSIHVDEKWFFIMKDKELYYLTTSEKIHIAQLKTKYELHK